MHARAILAMTESGATAMMMSRSETRIPIYALTPHERTRHRMALCRGVYPIAFESNTEGAPGLVKTLEAIECLKYRGVVADGDRVLVTKGDGVDSQPDTCEPERKIGRAHV